MYRIYLIRNTVIVLFVFLFLFIAGVGLTKAGIFANNNHNHDFTFPFDREPIYCSAIHNRCCIDYRTRLHSGYKVSQTLFSRISQGKFCRFYFSKVATFGATEKSPGSEGLLSEIRSLEIDSEENVYIADWKQHSTFKYDRHANLLLKIGIDGPGGPGDILDPAAIKLCSNNSLFIYDLKLERLSRFNSTGQFIECNKSDPIFEDWIFVDGKENLYSIFWDYSNKEKWQGLVKKSRDGKKILTIASYNREKFTEGIWVWNGDYNFPSIFLAGIDSDRFVFVNNMEPILYIVDTLKESVSLVRLNIMLEPFTSQEIIYHKNSYRNIINNMRLTPYRPFFRKILTDQSGNIFLVRLKSDLNKAQDWRIDVFDSFGKYRYSAQSPYLPEAIKYGSMYVSDIDNSGERILKKYTIDNIEKLNKI